MLKKLPIKPGIVKSNSPYSEPGRYVDGQWVRFVAGYAQKMGGWAVLVLNSASVVVTGVCRNIMAWRDHNEGSRAAFGTNSKLFVIGSALIDITPLRSRNDGDLMDALTTALGSASVVVSHIEHRQKIGDWVTLTAETEVGGLTIAGNYVIATAGADSYTVVASSEATSAETGGGAIAFVYYRRKISALNPILTQVNQSTVTIIDIDHLVIVGDTILIADAIEVGGITLSGSYVVVTVPNSFSFDIDAGVVASSTETKEQPDATIQYEINVGLIHSESTPFVSPPSVALSARTWALRSYGSWLLANPRSGGLYVWDSAVGGRAIALYRSPARMLSFFVTAERYIVALGVDDDSMQIAWSDQLDPTAWTAATTNTANESRKIIGGNFIMSGTQVSYQTSLIWTDTSTFLHQWRADDYIFTTALLATKCGIIGPNAFAEMGEAVYWIGDGHFWKWDGALTEIPSDDIKDWFFSRIDRRQDAKITMGTIAPFNELIVLYQETGETEIGHYLIYNILDEVWSTGTIQRTAWVDKGLFAYQMATSTAGVVFNHEVGLDGGGAIPARITAAPVDIDAGELNMDIMGFWPDLVRQIGTLSLYVLTRDNAADTPVSVGPFSLSAAGVNVDLRVDGKMVGYTLESNVLGGDFRLGVCRVDAQPAGSRR